MDDYTGSLYATGHERPHNVSYKRELSPSPLGNGYGPKSCAQCGTTRTPQWREGPLGPKTLCNACGVKRVRQMRTAQEGKRKAPATPPPSHRDVAPQLPPHLLQALNVQPITMFKQSTPEPTTRSSDSQLEAPAAAAARAREATSYKRPVRKAAAKAATRTAEYANTGDWPEHDADSYGARSQPAESITDSQHNSDSAEEVAWVPSASPLTGTLGVDCIAAVDLLSMSVKEADISRATGAGLDPELALDMGSNASGSGVTPASFAALSSCASLFDHDLVLHEEDIAVLQNALRFAPAGKVVQFMQIKEALDSSVREVATSEAAVAAVAKILAAKQAGSIRARCAAKASCQAMRGFLSQLSCEFLQAAPGGAKKRRVGGS